jgi:hypothetical protein
MIKALPQPAGLFNVNNCNCARYYELEKCKIILNFSQNHEYKSNIYKKFP